VFVLLAVMVALTLASSFLGAQSTSIGVARNGGDHAKARAVAESGLAFACAYVEQQSAWRTLRPHGTWATNVALGDGSFTVVGQDGRDQNGDGVISVPSEGDGSLSDDANDVLTLTVTGRVGQTSHVVRAVVTPQPGATGLVGYWKLDESSGLGAPDASGLGHPGVLINMKGDEWTSGKAGRALQFDGTNDVVRVLDHNDLDLTTAGTLACWMKVKTYGPFAGIIHKGGQTSFNDETYSLQFWDGTRMRLYLNSASSSVYLETATSFSRGVWYHVAAVWDGSGMRFYVNGNLDRSTTTKLAAKTSTGNVHVGAQLVTYYSSSYKNFPFDGVLDDVRMYNRALSIAEVQDIVGGADTGSGTGGYTITWDE